MSKQVTSTGRWVKAVSEKPDSKPSRLKVRKSAFCGGVKRKQRLEICAAVTSETGVFW